MNYLLVGNGPSALERQVGALIDAFDGVVVRFNYCPREKDGVDLTPLLGSRTDMWATGGATKGVPMADLGQTHDLLTVPPDYRPYVKRTWADLVAAGRNPAHVTWGTYNRVKSEMRSSPSSGALVAAHLLEQGHRVFIHGFDFMVRSRGHHYWDDSKYAGDIHIPAREREWFMRLLVDSETPILRWDPDEGAHLVEMYQQLYASPKGDKYRSYSHKLYSDLVHGVLAEAVPKTILEYGCGRSTLGVAAADTVGAELLRYDPAIPEFSTRPYRPVDLIITTDVLEHIPLGDIPAILDYPAKYHFHAICCRPAHMILSDGNNAHCTVRNPLWWEGYLTSHYGRSGRKVAVLTPPTPDVAVFLAGPA